MGGTSRKDEEAAPVFNNYKPEELPIFTEKEVRMRLIAGDCEILSQPEFCLNAPTVLEFIFYFNKNILID